MKDRIILFIYIALVVILTSIHKVEFFLLFLGVLFLISYKDLIYLAKKTILSIIFFNSVISISYILINLIKGKPWFDYILLLNLRVFSLTYLTFYIFSKINIFKALSFSRSLSYILTLSYSQILNFQKTYIDFKYSLKSRTIKKPKLSDLYNYISSVFYYFFNKSLKNSEEISQAMKSRGFFND